MFKIIKKLRWFYPGIKVKRWIFLSVVGIVVLIIGSVRFFEDRIPLLRIIDILIILIGATLLILGVRSLVKSFLSLIAPPPEAALLDIIYRKRHLEKGPRIVTIGGGHGLSTLLMGLKKYTTNICAVVTVADSGGSSGRLRKEFGMLPPGDIRNCLVSLADSSPLMGDLFQYRFKKDSELKGHNFGNLFIAAMTQLTGDFKKAVEESSRVLAVRGKVLPSTLHRVSLVAEFKDGSLTEGEADIPEKRSVIKKVYLKTTDSESTQEIKPNFDAVDAIRNAQVIIIGPGSLYTSILPNLVIGDITQAIVESRALKVYVCNVMTQHGETDGYNAFDHLEALINHTHPRLIDYAIVNTQIPDAALLSRYREERAFPVKAKISKIKKAGYKVIGTNLIHAKDFVRHDSDKLSRLIVSLYRAEAIHREI